MVTGYYDPQTQKTKQKSKYLGMADEKGGKPYRKQLVRPVMATSDALGWLLCAATEKGDVVGEAESVCDKRERNILLLSAIYILMTDSGLDGLPEWREALGNDRCIPSLDISSEEVVPQLKSIGNTLRTNHRAPPLKNPSDVLFAVYPTSREAMGDREDETKTDWDAEIKRMFKDPNNRDSDKADRPFPLRRALIGTASTGQWQLALLRPHSEELPHVGNMRVTRIYDVSDEAVSVDEVRHIIRGIRKQAVCTVGKKEQVRETATAIQGDTRELSFDGNGDVIVTNRSVGDATIEKRIRECLLLKLRSDDVWKRMCAAFRSTPLMRRDRDDIAHTTRLIALAAFRIQRMIVNAAWNAGLVEGGWDNAWEDIKRELSGKRRDVYRNGEVQVAEAEDYYHALAEQLGVGV